MDLSNTRQFEGFSQTLQQTVRDIKEHLKRHDLTVNRFAHQCGEVNANAMNFILKGGHRACMKRLDRIRKEMAASELVPTGPAKGEV